MTEAPLHPRRLAAALQWLREIESDLPGCGPLGIPVEHYESMRLCLKLVLNSQQRMGLTPGVADAIGHGVSLVDYVKKALTPK